MDKWGYKLFVTNHRGAVMVSIDYFTDRGASLPGQNKSIVIESPNWFERLLRITWKMKVDTATHILMRIASKKIDKLNDGIEFVNQYGPGIELNGTFEN